MPAILLLLMIGEVVVYVKEVSKRDGLIKKIEQANNYVEHFIKNPKSAPSQKQYEQIQQFADKTNTILSQTKYTLEKMVENEPILKALEFKEKLRSYEDSFRKYKIPIQEGIGFKDYMGGLLPAEEQLEMLSKQLYWIVKMLHLLIENGVDSVTEIARSSAVEEIENVVSKNEKHKLFRLYRTQFTFRMSHKALLSTLKSISEIPKMVKIEFLSIKKSENANSVKSLNVTMQISLVEYVS